MRGLISSLAFSGVVLAGVIGQHALAAQPATLACVVAKGHVCQFAVRTGATQVNFALPSGQKKRVPRVDPRASLYCVCDPGPVTPDCKEPRVGFWCLGSWAPVLPGVNSGELETTSRFAIRESDRAN
jgi:hypothetical protein